MSTLDPGGAVVVVTGGGDGIGRAMVHSFARRGSRVVVSDIDGESAAAVAKEVTDAGGDAWAMVADVTRGEDVHSLADAAFARYGRVDVLCNNAGVTARPLRATWHGSDAEIRRIFDVNFFGTLNGVRAFLPRMLEQTARRSIVNTSSIVTLSDHTGHSMYAASKAAIDSISNTLRAELNEQGHDIGVTIVHPGPVRTSIAEPERLWRPTHASPSAGVEPWRRRGSRDALEWLEPEAVGEAILTAVLAGDAYCLTHPAPRRSMQRRIDRITESFRSN